MKVTVSVKKPEGFVPHVEVAAVYIECQEKILLLQHASYKELIAYLWGVPAGKLEKGEPSLQGAQRELWEETGLSCDLERLHPIEPLYVQRDTFSFIYHPFALFLDHKPALILSREHTSFRWVSKEEAAEMALVPAGHHALAHYYRFKNSCD